MLKSKKENKFIRLAELSLMDFITRSKDEVLRFFTTTPQHWMMLHKVVIAYYKNETISKKTKSICLFKLYEDVLS